MDAGFPSDLGSEKAGYRNALKPKENALAWIIYVFGAFLILTASR